MKPIRFYVTDMQPNGTRDLIITDPERCVLVVETEAVFGGRTEAVPDPRARLFIADDMIVGVDLDDEAAKNDDFAEVFSVSWSWIKRHMAVSPVVNVTEASRALDKAVNDALRAAR